MRRQLHSAAGIHVVLCAATSPCAEQSKSRVLRLSASARHGVSVAKGRCRGRLYIYSAVIRVGTCNFLYMRIYVKALVRGV